MMVRMLFLLKTEMCITSKDFAYSDKCRAKMVAWKDRNLTAVGTI